jgi:hypothetical protein
MSIYLAYTRGLGTDSAVQQTERLNQGRRGRAAHTHHACSVPGGSVSSHWQDAFSGRGPNERGVRLVEHLAPPTIPPVLTAPRHREVSAASQRALQNQTTRPRPIWGAAAANARLSHPCGAVIRPRVMPSAILPPPPPPEPGCGLFLLSSRGGAAARMEPVCSRHTPSKKDP